MDKYIGQFFEHLSFAVVDKWYILGEYHNSIERSTKGRIGDIGGKPDENDLKKIRMKAKKLALKLWKSTQP